MPRYRYTDPWPRTFFGLSCGDGVTVIRQDPDAPPDPPGSTVVLHPGDELQTAEPYEHPLLTPEPAEETSK